MDGWKKMSFGHFLMQNPVSELVGDGGETLERKIRKNKRKNPTVNCV